MKRDYMFNGHGQMQALRRMDKKNIYTYISLEYEKPTHKAFISVRSVEDCWEVKTRGEASEALKSEFDLNEVSVEVNEFI